MNELSKTQRLQAERDRVDKELQIEQAREDLMQTDLVDGEGLTEEVASRIVGADKFMRQVTIHMIRTTDALAQIKESQRENTERIEKRLDNMAENGLKLCEGRRVEIEHLKESDKAQWSAINKTARSPRQKTMAWGAGGVGIGGAVMVVLDWIVKHW